MTPSWFSNSLEQRTDLRKVLYLLLLVYYEGYNSEAAKWKRCTGQVTGKGAQSFHVLSGCVASQHCEEFNNSEAPGSHRVEVVRGFIT